MTNVDRTPRNPNLLVWHDRVWLIDHGAALYFHHRDWDPEADAAKPFPAIADHVLLPCAGSIADADARLAERLTADALRDAVSLVPAGVGGRASATSTYLTRAAGAAAARSRRRRSVPRV